MSEPEIKRTIMDEDVHWVMRWAKYGGKRDGSMDDELKFEAEKALAFMLINEVIFLNDSWWKEELPEEERKIVRSLVNCSDVFAWGCSDAEDLPYGEIENLYRMWRKDPAWGPAVWCMIRRRQMPQRPLENIIRKAGIWDLDALQLGTNWQDVEVAAMLRSLAPSIKAAIEQKA